MTFLVCNLLDENIHFVEKTSALQMAPAVDLLRAVPVARPAADGDCCSVGYRRWLLMNLLPVTLVGKEVASRAGYT
jgi:hypothetical protein